MEELHIHTAIHSRYQVFDASGQHPFSIVFGLCRRSPNDTDPRPIVLHAANSVLDVPYAIAHRLLTLHEHHGKEGRQEKPIDFPAGQLQLPESEAAGTYLSLPSPVDRTAHWKDAMTVYQYQVTPNSELASVLQPGRKYTIRLAGKDLGVKWWTYGDDTDTPLSRRNHSNKVPTTTTTKASETTRLINSKSSAGRASFAVVPELPRPPKVETHMRLCRSSADRANLDEGDDDHDRAPLEISVLHTGAQPLTVQTRGPQRFLIPWGPFQPEEIETSRPLIINAAAASPAPAPTSSLQVVDAGTGEVVVRAPAKHVGCAGLTAGNVDPRPRLDTLVTLMPGEPLVRRVDISGLVKGKGVPDGRYRVQMLPRGMWWCGGSCTEMRNEGDGERVPWQWYRKEIPPLMLETDDTVDVRVENGKIR